MIKFHQTKFRDFTLHHAEQYWEFTANENTLYYHDHYCANRDDVSNSGGC